jgi:hypothetical protein
MTDKNRLAYINASEQELKETTELWPDTLVDVGFESMKHLAEHFKLEDPLPTEKAQDFCFCFFNAYAGTDKKDLDAANATAIYYNGNLDLMAHLLAAMMRKDPKICHMVHHTMHAYRHGL